MAYGLPYKGSKNTIREFVYNTIYNNPIGGKKEYTHFYDVFGGGGAITHIMLEKSTIPHIHINDRLKSVEVFMAFATNTFEQQFGSLDKHCLYTRDQYKAKIAKEGWTAENVWLALIYGFNSGLGHSYGVGEENMKTTLYQTRTFLEAVNKCGLSLTEALQQDKNCGELYKQYTGEDGGTYSGRILQRMKRCVCIASSLKDKDVEHRLTYSELDYKELKIEDGSLVYLDPPYLNRTGYDYKQSSVKQRDFDYNEFYKWCEDLAGRCDVYMSSLEAPEHWALVAERLSRFSSGQGNGPGGSVKCQEKIFKPRRAK